MAAPGPDRSPQAPSDDGRGPGRQEHASRPLRAENSEQVGKPVIAHGFFRTGHQVILPALRDQHETTPGEGIGSRFLCWVTPRC
jgi:hypothetical protein